MKQEKYLQRMTQRRVRLPQQMTSLLAFMLALLSSMLPTSSYAEIAFPYVPFVVWSEGGTLWVNSCALGYGIFEPEIQGYECWKMHFDPSTAPDGVVAAPPEGPPDGGCNTGGGPVEEGDPVDCYTGLFLHRSSDLFVRDVIPLEVSRSYRSRDATSRSFGAGATLSYDILLAGDAITYADLILPDGGRIHFSCPDTTSCESRRMTTAGNPGIYNGAVLNMRQNRLTLKDGSSLQFGAYVAPNVRTAALVSTTDRNGNSLTFSRDTKGNLTQVTSPNGRHLYFTYDALNRITSVRDDINRQVIYDYDNAGNLQKVTDPLNYVESYEYDSNHNMKTVTDKRRNVMVTNTYDNNQRVIKQVYADNTSASFVYTLDSNGKVTQTDFTNERSITKRIIFNSSGYPTSIIEAVGKPEQRTTSFVRDANTNQVLSETDGLSRVTAYKYDQNGNLLTLTRMQGTPEETVWTMTYDQVFNQLTSITDPLTNVTKYKYDDRGNLIEVTDPMTNVTDTDYDTQGRPQAVKRYVNGKTLAATLLYDSGDLVGITDPLGHTISFFPDAVGRIVNTSDSFGNFHSTTYDALDRVVLKTDPLGQTVQIHYDPLGNLTSFKDSNNNETSFVYDVRNRLYTRTDSLNATETYLYDPVGNLSSFTDRRGLVSSFTYDSLNRQLTAVYGATAANPTAYKSTISNTWDAGDRLKQILDSVSGTLSRSYDGNNRILTETTPQGQVSYTYYDNGQRKTMTVLGQAAVNYVWDAANRPSSITQGSAVVGFGYDSANRRTSLTLPSGIVLSYGYDDVGHLISLTYMKGATTLGTLTYAYDDAGRRIGAGGSLLNVSLPTSITNAQYDAANRVLTWNGNALGYDSNGNLTVQGEQTYVWDERNRLTQVLQGSNILSSYQYDAFDRRISKTINGTSTDFLYDGAQIVQESNGAIPKANLLTGLGLDELFRRTEGTTTRDYITDALGSTVALVDGAGTIKTNYSYDPYGNTSSTGEESSNAFQYTGRENDGTGLYYYRARYYQPGLNRFISQDPIGLVGGDNLYVYGDGNPLINTDPNGLAPVGFIVKLLNNGRMVIGKAVGDITEAVAARQAGKNVVMGTKQAAKQVETAANGGNVSDVLRHRGHDLPNGATGLPHYQTDGAYGHTFWGNVRGAADPELLGLFSVGLGFLLHSNGTGGCDSNGHCSDEVSRTNPCAIKK